MKSVNSQRVYNFSSGPAVMPVPVLEKAREELLSAGGKGMSVMEMSHRSDILRDVLMKAERGLRELLNAPEDYRILFLQGGASMQFSMVPMNFLTHETCGRFHRHRFVEPKGSRRGRSFRRCQILSIRRRPTGIGPCRSMPSFVLLPTRHTFITRQTKRSTASNSNTRSTRVEYL